ncbi:MAG: tRNA (adenosine(37)-N6)-threonylcarbamoyltransferase complex ATPase subunit type 1 TsaE [Dehalococcoidia bacterium]|nr:MAG: tRNA (adenosine(37)-N6)-threonylcarbamoyltransferase complex ATPase subunit type 1 TsaE [Dehalococcoidia bacterium]
MESLDLNSHSPEQTQLLGSCLGELAQRADVFLLVGELGAGKTCLAQGIARGLEVEEYAFSPSFVILREYHGRLPLYHIDFYRLDRIEEIADLALEEYFFGDGVCVIEWAEKGLPIVPRDNLLITIRYTSAAKRGRSVSLKPQGQRYRELIEQLKIREGIMALRRSRLTR